ncbi:MAG: hypothetical protein IJA76_01640 [Clostridia bacterium]|nr:hypothetical protein [Clostridia bacterium]
MQKIQVTACPFFVNNRKRMLALFTRFYKIKKVLALPKPNHNSSFFILHYSLLIKKAGAYPAFLLTTELYA